MSVCPLQMNSKIIIVESGDIVPEDQLIHFTQGVLNCSQHSDISYWFILLNLLLIENVILSYNTECRLIYMIMIKYACVCLSTYVYVF